MDTPKLDELFGACVVRHLDPAGAMAEVKELQDEIRSLRETIRVERESRSELFQRHLTEIAENERLRVQLGKPSKRGVTKEESIHVKAPYERDKPCAICRTMDDRIHSSVQCGGFSRDPQVVYTHRLGVE